MPANVGQILEEMDQSKRDQVVMVRVDEVTAQELAAWVETGAVNEARQRLRERVREVLGTDEESPPQTPTCTRSTPPR